MMMEEGAPKPTDRIYNLVDEVEGGTAETRGRQEIIVVDGRGYERSPGPEEKIYDLTNVLEEGEITAFSAGAMDDQISKIAVEVAERIAREVIPGIAERVIREEIERLKREEQN